MAEENVVIYKVHLDEQPISTVSYGRDTLEVATAFCKRQPAEYMRGSYLAVDDWGYGNIVASTPDLSNWIGHSIKQFKREAH